MVTHLKSVTDIIEEQFPGIQITSSELIQELWSGYGTLKRLATKDDEIETLIVKEVSAPKIGTHPRGWATDVSHQRKLHSYTVEANWYLGLSKYCNESCRVPICYAACRDIEHAYFVLILEDLDRAGFFERRSYVTVNQMKPCLEWLANFHAIYLQVDPVDLWQIGSYWHLATRLDELEALEDERLKKAAPIIDEKLSSAMYQTIIHGDAKLANFCFSKDLKQVAAVDFQYVGGGVGVKDVAYFIGSCLREDDCEIYEKELLDCYFSSLDEAVKKSKPQIDSSALIAEWNSLYHIAWADFHRFLKGWSPEHWKLSRYSHRVTDRVLDKLHIS